MRELFESTIERLLADLVTPELIRHCEAGHWPADLWAALESSGFAVAAAPEHLGGAGASWEDLYGVVKAAGRHNLPLPLPETMFANWLLGQCGIEARNEPLGISMRSTLSLNHAAKAAFFDAPWVAPAETLVTGTLCDVPWGRDVEHVVALVPGERTTLILLSRRDAEVSTKQNTAGEPRDDLSFKNTTPIAIADVPADWPDDVIWWGGAMLRTAQMAGALETTLDLSTRYATERVQFGKPISAFQAIQHQLAQMAQHTGSALVSAEAAFAESGNQLAAWQIAAAKVCGAEAAGAVAADGPCSARCHRLYARACAAVGHPPALGLAQRVRQPGALDTAAGKGRRPRRLCLAVACRNQWPPGSPVLHLNSHPMSEQSPAPFLLIERDGPVLTARLNRPETRNALTDPAHMEELVALCRQIRADHSIKALVLTGEGSAFCAGGNVKDMQQRGGIFAGSPYEVRDSYRDTIQRIPLALYELDVPVIAAVNGAAIGAGLDLACMCDIRIASDKALFAESFVKVGIVPGDGGAWLLPRVIGMPKASLLAFTGDTIDAAKALSWGLVADVFPADQLLGQAQALAQRIALNPSHALRLTKRLLREGQHVRLDTLLELSSAYQALSHHTEDHLEAVNAFLDKRPAQFTGR